MDLLEYQAKELFREMGIPVLPSQRIDNPRDLRGLHIPYPVVLKSQVRAGGRGKAGGVRFVENTIDAIAAARTIFNLPIVGEYPQVLLAEAKYDVNQEFYLAVVLDYTLRRPVLLGSSQGGINVEGVMEQMQLIVVDQEFSPFYARHLAVKMGLEGVLIQSVSTIVEKMYQLFIQKDLDGVEINPLGVSATGEVMALDGKVTVNDSAIGRHPDLARLVNPKTEALTPEETSTQLTTLNWIDREGNIGILCNGSALGIAMVDLISQAGGRPSFCLMMGGQASWDLTPTCIQEHLEQALEQLIQHPNIRVVLVNIVGGAAAVEAVVTAMTDYVQHKLSPTVRMASKSSSLRREPSVVGNRRLTALQTRRYHQPALPQFVVRLIGAEMNKGQDQLTTMIHWMGNLDDSVRAAVSLATSTAKSIHA